MSLCISLHLVC